MQSFLSLTVTDGGPERLVANVREGLFSDSGALGL